jgi:hypothetical protein
MLTALLLLAPLSWPSRFALTQLNSLCSTDFRDGEKLFCAYVREYASLTDSCQSGVLSGKNLFGACSNRVFQDGECFGTALVSR